MAWLEPITLRGQHAHLVPLEIAHGEALERAARDGELWRLWYTSVPPPEGMAKEIERRLRLQSQGTMLPLTVLEADSSAVVGMTTYMNVDQENRRVEIGSTWYAKRVQRTPLNTECKLMLLRHAFETLDCVAVEFRTSFFNQQSRKAIERLGAKLDGILRNHSRHADGSLRDTCVYSILLSEWPAVRSHLAHQLERPR
jgi:RimJ/RimL family protein N-acetyltransferase